jgi:peptidoglycan/LPS O-acetylase OafA/YrhL
MILMTLAKKWIASIWLICGPVLMIMAMFLPQNMGSSAISKSWFISNIVPALSLIVGVLVYDLLQPEMGKQVDKYLFWLALYLSILYLGVLFLLMMINNEVQTNDFDPKSIVISLNGILNAVLGVFFVKGERTKINS